MDEREEGSDFLVRAAVAFRAALEIHTRERAPRDWTKAQCSLGLALTKLGERQSNAEYLEQGTVVLKEALEESEREEAPSGWADIRNKLDTALTLLNELRQPIKQQPHEE